MYFEYFIEVCFIDLLAVSLLLLSQNYIMIIWNGDTWIVAETLAIFHFRAVKRSIWKWNGISNFTKFWSTKNICAIKEMKLKFPHTNSNIRYKMHWTKVQQKIIQLPILKRKISAFIFCLGRKTNKRQQIRVLVLIENCCNHAWVDNGIETGHVYILLVVCMFIRYCCYCWFC